MNGYTDPRTGVFYPNIRAADLQFTQQASNMGGDNQQIGASNPAVQFIGNPQDYWGSGMTSMPGENYWWQLDDNGNPTLQIKTGRNEGERVQYRLENGQYVPVPSSQSTHSMDTTPTFLEQGGGVALAALGGLGAQWAGLPAFNQAAMAPWEAGLTNLPLAGAGGGGAGTGLFGGTEIAGPPVGAANPGVPGSWAPGSFAGDPWAAVGGGVPTDPGPIPPDMPAPPPGQIPGAPPTPPGAGTGLLGTIGDLVKKNPGLLSLGAGLLGGMFGNSGTQVEDLYGGRKAAMDRLAANKAPASPWGRY